MVGGDSCRHTGLIISYWDSYLGNALGKRLQYGIESRMGDTDRRLFQQLQLRRMINHDRIFRHRTDLLRPEYIANGKHKLCRLMLWDSRHDRTKYMRVAILNSSHLAITDRLPGQSVPRNNHLSPPFTIID